MPTFFNDLQSDPQIFVDIPSQLEANNSSQRGRSPCTPKRPRSQVKPADSSFDGLSPIGSPKQYGFSPDFEPMSTPKRRKSSSSGLRSSMGEFSQLKLHECAAFDRDSGLSKSVDFSKIPSFRIPTNQFSTPKKRPKLEADRSPPPAPQKMRRSSMNLDRDSPTPTKLFQEELGAKDVVESTENAPASVHNIAKLDPVDYASAMGIVGFISSHLVRTGERCVSLSNLVQIVSAASVAHRTPTSALAAVRDLARAVPEWVTVAKESGSVVSYKFSDDMRTSEVLQKLRELKRKQTMEETADLRSSIADLRASLSDLRAMSTARQ